MNKLVINKEDLLQNVQKIKEHAKINLPDDNGRPVKIIVVVKSNAYGLDLKQYTEFMVNQGLDFFAVSTVQEAIEFRKLGFTQQLLMLSSTAIKEEVELLIKNNVIITIGSKEAADVVCKIATECPEQKIKAHIKIDTGFGRYGFVYTNREFMVESLKKIQEQKNVEIQGTFTHFSNSYYDEKYTKLQFKRYIDCIEVLKMNNIETGMLHVCNSSAFIKFPEMHLNAVRVGSAFIGKLAFQNNIGLKKVAKLESQVTEIKELPEKFNVGYSNAYKTKKSTRVAIIPCGYINGVDVQVGRDMFRTVDKIRYVVRDLKDMFKKQNHSVFINNQRCEILGRIGTYHVTVDITGKNININDEAIFNVSLKHVDSGLRREWK